MTRLSWGLGVRLWVAALFCVMVAPTLQAAEIKNLYQAQVIVPDQGRESRAQAFSQALAQVVIKVTGQIDAPAREGVRIAMQKPDVLVSRYDYRKINAGDGDQANRQPGFTLDVSFNRVAVNKLLHDNQLPLWGDNRPETLIWVASEERGGRQMLGAESPSTVVAALQKASDQWGVPLLYPLLDVEDSLSLSMAELWGLFPAPVVQASGRYGVDPVLAMRVYSSGPDKVSGRVMFAFRGQVFNEDINDVTMDVFASRALSLVASRLAAFYAILSDGSSEHPLRLQVNAVNDVHDYAGLLRYLENLTAVRTVMPVRVKGDTLTLDLVIDGSPEQVDAEISLDRNLTRAYPALPATPVEVSEGEPVRRPDLYYMWQK